MFRKKDPQKQQPKEYQVQPAPTLPTNIPRANLTTWPQQWEYKWVQLSVAQFADPSNILALLGTEGWELVSAYVINVPVLGPAREFCFKRPKLSEAALPETE